MTANDSMDKLLRRLNRRRLNTATASLYIEGVNAKLQAAFFALENLRPLEHVERNAQVQDGTTVQITQSLLTVDDKVNFYCECFWDFLRSSLDILAQLINKLHPLNMNERQVDYKQVARKLNSNEQGTLLEQAVSNCQRSAAFKNLEEYRHCSIHRRQVFIETRTHTTSITGTRGYYVGTSRTTVERYICKNPWNLQPTVDDKRPLVEYCEHLLQSIERRISTIINRLP